MQFGPSLCVLWSGVILIDISNGYAKKLYDFCFSILTVFGGKMMSYKQRQSFIFTLWLN